MRHVLFVLLALAALTGFSLAAEAQVSTQETSMDWKASWIWHPQALSQDNLYVHARKVIQLPQPPHQARLFVSAGSLYRLWINGQYVGRGPNPADPSYYYYDVHDVARFLKPGANVIAVTAYSYGPKAHGVIFQNYGPGGLLLELRDESGKTLAATDDTWHIIQAPEWDQNSELNNTLYGDFKEVVDSRKEPVGWHDDVKFDDSKWLVPSLLGKPPAGPYPSPREREIPFLTYEPVYPVDAFWDSASVTYAWRDDWEVYHEHGLVPGSPFDNGAKPMEVRKTHDDFTPSVMFDFGKLVTGYPEISIKDSAGGVVDVLYGEDLHLVRIDRIHLRGGAQVLQPFGRRTFRYLKLLFPELPRPVSIDRVLLNLSTYPVDKSASTFACSDPLLNRAYETAKYTIRLAMLDHLVDCPGRERSFYGGDVYVESLFVHYAFGDPRITEKTVRQNFAIQYPQGALPCVGPYSGFDSFYPSWSAFVGLALLDDYQYTGSKTLVQELWPHFTRLMDFAIGQMEKNDVYLIGEPAHGGRIETWMEGPRIRYNAWSNFPYYRMLRQSAAMARTLGHNDEASRYESAADKMRDAIRKYLVGDDGMFATWPRDKHSDQSKAHENGLLAWSGALDAGVSEHIADELLKPTMPPSGGGFQDFFITQDGYELADAGRANDYIRRTWGDMLARGATTFWEHSNPNLPPGMKMSWGTSYCHGWAAGPVYLLPAYVLGIRPLAPGFEKVLIAPQPGSLAWAEGKVPTPHGPVSVRWNTVQGELRLRIGSPSPVRFNLPSPLVKQVSVNGTEAKPAKENQILFLDLPAGEHEILCH